MAATISIISSDFPRLEPVGDVEPLRDWRMAGDTIGRWDEVRQMSLPDLRPWPPELMPLRARMQNKQRVPDMVQVNRTSNAVSSRLKDLIESIEPGVHCFVPFEVLRKDGAPTGETYWYFKIMTLIDAVNPVLGGLKKSVLNPNPDHSAYRWVIQSFGDDKLAVYKDRVAGRAMWNDLRYSAPNFYSDQLLNAMASQKMDGYTIQSYWQEL